MLPFENALFHNMNCYLHNDNTNYLYPFYLSFPVIFQMNLNGE